MKFTQIAQALALAGSATAATYSNSSYVPSGSGYFYNGTVYYSVSLPNSGFTNFEIYRESNDITGASIDQETASAVYSPAGTPFEVVTHFPSNYLEIDGNDVQFSSPQESIDVSFNGKITEALDAYVIDLQVILEGLPEQIQKREDQTFDLVITATSSSPSGPTTSSSSNSTTTPPPTTSGTITTQETTVITVTSCSDDKCTDVPVTTGLTTVTEKDTTYTTYCPLSTVTTQETTVITITSCSEDKCTEVPVTTGVTTVTENETTYTTYCPLTTEETSKPTAAPTTEKPTEQPTKQPTTVTSVTSASSQAPSNPSEEASTFEGAAPAVKATTVFAGLTFLLTFLL